MGRWTLLFLGLTACGGGGHEAPPVARDDQFTIAEDAVTGIDDRTIEANDDGVAGIRVVIPPAHGTVAGSGGNYTPDPGYHGTDSFVYEAHNDNGDTARATVSITITSDGVPYEQSQRLDTGVASDLAVADITGDGAPDLVICDKATSSIRVLVNTTSGPGAYAVAPITFEGGHAPAALAVADVDGDGRPDVITASGNDGLVVLRNLTAAGGPVAFDAPIYVAAGTPVDVVAADLNGDGLPDLASIDSNFNTLDIRFNASTPGAVAFGARTSFDTSVRPISVEAVDADGAGGIDLAVLSTYPGELSLFTNATGVGDTLPVFGTRIDRATGTSPDYLFVADLDGDARPELGVIGPDLWIYKNQSPSAAAPSYQAARVLDLATAGVPLAADLDGQAGTDLLLGSPGNATPTMLFNRTTAAAGFDFAAHPVQLGDFDTGARVNPGASTGIARVDLDGAAPAEIVVTGTTGTFVLFGD